jgi:chromosome segregation ATPase
MLSHREIHRELIVTDGSLSGPPADQPLTLSSSAELASLRETITSLTTENATLVNRLTTLENTISTLRTDAGLLIEARAENARLEEESRELRSQLEVQGTKLAGFERIKEDMDAVRAESEDAASRAIKSEGEVERLEKEVERLKKEVDEKDEAVKNQTEELETRLTRQREREGGLEAEVARLKQVNGVSQTLPR